MHHLDVADEHDVIVLVVGLCDQAAAVELDLRFDVGSGGGGGGGWGRCDGCGVGGAFQDHGFSFFFSAFAGSAAGAAKESLDASTIAATAFGSTRCINGWNNAIS